MPNTPTEIARLMALRQRTQPQRDLGGNPIDPRIAIAPTHAHLWIKRDWPQGRADAQYQCARCGCTSRQDW